MTGLKNKKRWIGENFSWGTSEILTTKHHDEQEMIYNPKTEIPLQKWLVCGTNMILYDINGVSEIAICLDCNQKFNRYHSAGSNGSEVIRFIELHKQNADIVNDTWLCQNPPMPRIILL